MGWKTSQNSIFSPKHGQIKGPFRPNRPSEVEPPAGQSAVLHSLASCSNAPRAGQIALTWRCELVVAGFPAKDWLYDIKVQVVKWLKWHTA